MKYTKDQIIDFIVLLLRWYLAYYMIDYGWTKISGGQFGVREEILNTPLKDVDKFYAAWYLFSLNKWFNIIVGISQIIGGILIVINKTVIIGVLFLLPVLFQIFLVDVAFTTNMFGVALPLRLAGMIISALLILYYHKEKMLATWQILTDKTTKFKYKWWVYLLLPLLGLLMDFVWATFTLPIKYILNRILFMN